MIDAYRAGVGDGFFDAVPPEKMRALLADASKRHGTCRVGTPRKVRGPRSAQLRNPCERGHLDFDITLDGPRTPVGLLHLFGWAATQPRNASGQHRML